MNLCILDLLELTGGHLRLSAMPPRDGELTEVMRICLTAADVEPGEVFWRLTGGPCDVELAFLRGALGVVLCGPVVEPWPGCFCLAVDDSLAALERFVAGLQADAALTGEQESFSKPAELKDLQLLPAEGTAIFPPTCGQPGSAQAARRCRSAAA